MPTTAFLFPGQGTQRVGMTRDLLDRWPGVVAPLWAAADEVLGFGLTELCLAGPAERLGRTEITQPAVFVASLAAYRVLATLVPPPAVVAGHSLGEYPALVAAGVLAWTDALALVRRRGELMAAANESAPGAMAAAIGFPVDVVETLCAATAAAVGEPVEPANYNCRTQTVVSGTRRAVAEFAERADRLGILGAKIVRLDVGAPFHSSLMAPAAAAFEADLAGVRFADPRIPFVTGVTGEPVDTGAAARTVLRRQLTGPVRWDAVLSTIAGRGVASFVDVGPGRVLAGLCRCNLPGSVCYSAADPRRIETLATALGAPATR